MIEIKIEEYYNKPFFYKFMPEEVFSALEKGYLDGVQTVIVPRKEFEKMILKQRNNGS